MFRRVLHEKGVAIIVVYVDDLLVVTATKRDEAQAMEDLRFCFPIKDLGEASYYLGCHITRDRQAGTLKLDQHRYIQTVARRFDIKKTSVIPSAPGTKPLSKSNAPETEAEVEEMRHISYREGVRDLMWAATMTKSDLSHTGQQLPKFNENSRPAY